jgi:hypothetical protein
LHEEAGVAIWNSRSLQQKAEAESNVIGLSLRVTSTRHVTEHQPKQFWVRYFDR